MSEAIVWAVAARNSNESLVIFATWTPAYLLPVHTSREEV
jgi:hypothetical protein